MPTGRKGGTWRDARGPGSLRPLGNNLTSEQKRSICSTLASVVRASHLRESIDPERFFKRISSDIDLLVRGKALHLEPLWALLSVDNKPDALYGLFLKFEQAGSALGLNVDLPTPIVRMSRNARSTYLAEFDRRPKPSAPPPATEPAQWQASALTPLPFPTEMEAIAKAEGSSPRGRRAVTEETRRAIAKALVWAIKDSPVGTRVNSGQLTHTVLSNFDHLCDGTSYRFTPPLMGFFQVAEALPEDLFVAFKRFGAYLATLGITMVMPELGLTARQRVALERSVDESQELAELYPPPTDGDDKVVKPKKKKSETKQVIEEAATELIDGSERGLKKYGLESTGKKRSPAAMRLAVMGFVFVLAVVGLWLLRPIKQLDKGDYDPPMPIADAMWVEGTFYGVLDIERWNNMDATQRKLALGALEERLRKENRLSQVAIAHPNGRLAIFSVRGERLAASAEIMKLRD